MFLEDQISRLQARVKRINDNPSPFFLKCNKLRYEIELEDYLHVMEAWKTGKPISMMLALTPFATSMGFVNLEYISYGDRVPKPQKYFDIVERAGFSTATCDRTLTALGLALNGELPIPHLVVPLRMPCDPERWSAMAAAEHWGSLVYELDNAFGIHYDSLHYFAEQLGELIEFAEKKIPGIKYDEGKLLELLKMDREAFDLMKETYALRRRVPCPLTPKDTFRLAFPPSFYSKPARALQYYRDYHDEMFERADKGMSGVPEEKLRLAWLATGPFMGETFEVLSRKGCSIPWFHYGMATRTFGIVRDVPFDETTYGRKLTPLEEAARFINYNAWGELADKWIDPLIQVCRDLKIDAIVDFLQTGCVVTRSVRKILADGKGAR